MELHVHSFFSGGTVMYVQLPICVCMLWMPWEHVCKQEVCFLRHAQHLDHCETYAALLKSKEIDGLKLMELSSRDFSAMGIKSVMEQQSIIDVIDCEFLAVEVLVV